MKPRIKDRKKKKFLELFAKSGIILPCCEAIGVSRQTVFFWRKNDPAFQVAFDQAEMDACEVLELEARRRACEGFEEPVFFQGREVSRVTKYSDLLMMFMLKGMKPEKYRDNYQKPADSTMAESLAKLAEKLPV